jgi:hypothetical protein
MFCEASEFNQTLDSWDTRKVKTNMFEMLRFASSFNQPLNVGCTENVENMSHMFQSASIFNQPLDRWTIQESRVWMVCFKMLHVSISLCRHGMYKVSLI